jgi:hypothetical protein
MPTQELYHTWNKLISCLLPGERITRKRTLVSLLIGLYQSRSVHLSKIAEKVPGWPACPVACGLSNVSWRTLPYECENGMRRLPGTSSSGWQVESCV